MLKQVAHAEPLGFKGLIITFFMRILLLNANGSYFKQFIEYRRNVPSKFHRLNNSGIFLN
jgi:hypothetical protein